MQLNLLSGNIDSAKFWLNTIINDDVKSADFIELYSILIGLKETGKGLDSLNTSQIEALREIAGKQSVSGVAAENILTFINDEEYEEVFDNDLEDDEIRYSKIKDFEVFIYPNPATNELYIEFLSKSIVSRYDVSIFDLTGKLLQENKLNPDITNSINIKYLPSGLLLIKINEDGSMVKFQKIIK